MNNPSEIPKRQSFPPIEITVKEFILSLPPIMRLKMFHQVRQQVAEGDKIAESWLQQYGDLENRDEVN
jgi:hypothetical protein